MMLKALPMSRCGAACILCCRFAKLSDGCCRDIAGDAVDIYQAVLEKICRDIAEILPIIVRQF
jgi:hypothetical protein